MTGAPRLPFSCLQKHTDYWKLSGSLEVLPHFSTWGSGLPVLDSVCTFYVYCFWEETRLTCQPSTCFVRFFLVTFNSQILFFFTSFCLSVKTSFLIRHLISEISLFIFKISHSTSFQEGIVHLCSLRPSSEETRQSVIFNPPKP